VPFQDNPKLEEAMASEDEQRWKLADVQASLALASEVGSQLGVAET
jgi:hypothetical protein